ncbi:hypothetical protein, partial [Streptomyces lavenduligriseus]
QGVAVTATLPATVKETACDPKPDSSNGGVLTWNLTGGTTQHFTLTADVTPGQKDPDARVRIVVHPSAGADAAGEAVVKAIASGGGVTVAALRAAPSTVEGGSTPQSVLLSWDVAGLGEGSLEGATVTAKLPAGFKQTGSSPAPDSTQGGTLTWKLTGKQDARHFEVRCDVTLAAGGSASVPVEAVAKGGQTASDSVTVTADKPVVSVGAVSVSGTAVAPGSVQAGAKTSNVVFSWDVDQTGGLKGTTVTAQLPAQAKVVSFKPDGGTPSGQTITWTLTGTETKQHFSVTTDITAGEHDDKAEAAITAKPTSGTNATATITLPVDRKVVPVGAVSVSGTAVTPASVPAGAKTQSVVFSWDVDQTGGLKGTTVTAQLPAQAKVVSFKPDGGTPSGQTITWTLTGTETKQHFSVTTDITAGEHDDKAEAAITAKPTSGTNATATITLPVDPKTDPSHIPVLAIPTWKVFPAQAGRGSHVAFAFKIMNQGQGVAKEVKAAVTLPKGLTPAGEYKDAPGVWDAAKRTVTSAQGGTLKAGAYWWITVVAQVDSDAPAGDLEARISVTATGAGSVTSPARVTV